MDSYEERVSAAVTKWKSTCAHSTGPKHFADLLSVLDSYGQYPDITWARGEQIVTHVLCDAFDWHCRSGRKSNLEYGLLVGLLTNNRWHALLEKEETAHAFVCLAIRYVEERQTCVTRSYGENMLAWMAGAMAEWLTTAPGETPTIRAIAEALFGAPWCELVYDTRQEGVLLAEVIESTRPEFLPGRLKSHSVREVMPLPDMGTAS